LLKWEFKGGVSINTFSKLQFEKEWIAIARKRAAELDEGKVQPVSADKVRQKAMMLLNGI